MKDGVSAQVDGKDAIVVDLSEGGAQVISPNVLRPNQKIRVSVPVDGEPARLRATVAWASYELPKGQNPARYRAGIEFNDSDPRLGGYAKRNSKD